MSRQPLQLPRGVWAPAAVGIAFVAVPILAMATQLHWAQLPQLLTSDSAVTALTLSLRTALTATLLSAVMGIPLAMLLARGRGRWVSMLRACVLVPMVLPPVVAGLALLETFGRRGLLGATLDAWGIQVAFTTSAVILAETFVAMPFLVITLEGALRSRGDRHELVAATLGASPWIRLRRVTLPMVWPAVRAGLVLTFARALGEFGATITFAGSLEGVTRTLPLEIYLQREVDPDSAIAISLLLIAVAIVVIATTSRRRAAW